MPRLPRIASRKSGFRSRAGSCRHGCICRRATAAAKLPVVVTIPGMDSFKEISVAMYGDRWLSRGMAVLAVDGPGQYESAVLGIPVTVDNWAAAGTSIMNWLAKRAGNRHHAQSGFRATVSVRSSAPLPRRNEPRFKAVAVTSPNLEPGCHTIFEEASPTFKQRFMYMAQISDEATFRCIPQDHQLEGPRGENPHAVSVRWRRVRRARADPKRHTPCSMP